MNVLTKHKGGIFLFRKFRIDKCIEFESMSGNTGCVHMAAFANRQHWREAELGRVVGLPQHKHTCSVPVTLAGVPKGDWNGSGKGHCFKEYEEKNGVSISQV